MKISYYPGPLKVLLLFFHDDSNRRACFQSLNRNMHTIEKHYYLIAEDSVTFPAQANTIKSDMIFPTDNRTTDKMPNGEANIFRTQFLRVRLCRAASSIIRAV